MTSGKTSSILVLYSTRRWWKERSLRRISLRVPGESRLRYSSMEAKSISREAAGLRGRVGLEIDEHLGKQQLLFLPVQLRMKANETALRAGRTNTGQSKGQELR